MENEIKKILFYTGIPRLFRTTLIGYLHEISQVYPVVLLSEKLDRETEKILSNKELFPKLEEIIPAYQYTGEKRNVLSLAKNSYLYQLAKEVMSRHRPNVVIAENDVYLFESYLFRFAKKRQAMTLCFRGGFRMAEKGVESLWTILRNAYTRTPKFFPFFCRVWMVKGKKYIGHFLYYYLIPLTVGEAPFVGKSSPFFSRDISGLRDADFSIVFSKRDYDLCIAEGVVQEKLSIVPHPLERKTRAFFEKAYFLNASIKHKSEKNTVTIMPSSNEVMGIRRDSYEIISESELKSSMMKMLQILVEVLKGWEIFIKPHPVVEKSDELVQRCKRISDTITVVDPSEPADKYIERADVVIGLPPASNVLFTAFLQCPEKIILSLDFNHELLGDSYRDFKEIEYIDTEQQFVAVIEQIRDGRYQKRNSTTPKNNDGMGTVALLQHLMAKKQ